MHPTPRPPVAVAKRQRFHLPTPGLSRRACLLGPGQPRPGPGSAMAALVGLSSEGQPNRARRRSSRSEEAGQAGVPAACHCASRSTPTLGRGASSTLRCPARGSRATPREDKPSRGPRPGHGLAGWFRGARRSVSRTLSRGGCGRRGTGHRADPIPAGEAAAGRAQARALNAAEGQAAPTDRLPSGRSCRLMLSEGGRFC